MREAASPHKRLFFPDELLVGGGPLAHVVGIAVPIKLSLVFLFRTRDRSFPFPKAPHHKRDRARSAYIHIADRAGHGEFPSRSRDKWFSPAVSALSRMEGPYPNPAIRMGLQIRPRIQILGRQQTPLFSPNGINSATAASAWLFPCSSAV